MPSFSESEMEGLLFSALGSNTEVISQALVSLEKIARENLCFFLVLLGGILSSEDKDIKIRQLSAIIMKNTLIHSEHFQEEWKTKLSQEEKGKIKLLVLSCLASQFKEIRSSTSSLIASICKIEQPISQHWPDIIPALTKNCFNENLNMKLSAIETLGYVCEEISSKGIDTSSVDSILTALIKNISDDKAELVVVQQCLKALFHTIHLAKKNFSTENEMKIIMESIFLQIQKFQNQDDVLDKIAMLFIEMFSVSSYYDYIDPYFPKIIEFSFHLINTKAQSNERLSLLGLEIICSLGDEELAREGLDAPKDKKTSTTQTAKQSKKYFNRISTQLQELIIKNVVAPEEDEDDNEWNLSKGFLYVLSIYVQIADKKNIQQLFSLLQGQITSIGENDSTGRTKCFLLMGGSLSTQYRDDAIKILPLYFGLCIRAIKDEQNIQVLKSASFLLLKITQYFPKLISPEYFEKVIPVFLERIQNSSGSVVVGINLCQVIQNIHKSYGDIETKKNTNQLSGCFNSCVSTLLQNSFDELKKSNEDYNKLIFAKLMTVDKVIEYSSHDKQEMLSQILLHTLKQVESTITQFDMIKSMGVKEETIFQIQDYYYTLLRTLFKKYKKPIETELGENIWKLTDMLLKLRKTVFEEANLALGALSLNMKENFSKIFPLYLPFLEFSIKSYQIPGLSKSGLTALLCIIRGIGDQITQASEPIIKALIEVCTSPDVVRGNKTVAITCLGEIAITIGEPFSIYLDTVMTLLFSACQMANIPVDDDDEDTIEFVKDLRFELIQTFTCIEFSLETKINLFVPYVQNIFGFFKAIVNDKKCMRFDILNAMLGFVVDMIKAFGLEMKSIFDQEFAKALLQNLRSYNLHKYDADISQQEEIINMLFKK